MKKPDELFEILGFKKEQNIKPTYTELRYKSENNKKITYKVFDYLMILLILIEV